jgi:CRISPR-associated exonuclease Cas4
VERALPLFSERYGLTGKADVVEFLADGTPYPVEYKQGKRQQKLHDEVQLAAQALCLEEMTGKVVPEGAIYHHKTRRRRVVLIDAALREHTIALVQQVRDLLASGVIPAPTSERALCQNCSLIDACQPDLVGKMATLARLHQHLFKVEDE